MRFKVGPTSAEQIEAEKHLTTEQERLNQWHPHYCLFPRRIGHLLVWLEYVERKRVQEWTGYYYGWAWEYRTPDQAEHPMNQEAA